MRLPTAPNWLRAPANRDVIKRWTPDGGPGKFRLGLPPLADPERFEFVVFGDSGDSELTGAHRSPQDAVASELIADVALPDTPGHGALVLHTGDLVYMTGERRLYDRNFRRPYAPLLTTDSTFEALAFRVPFLPVPGNHDYYDFPRWASALVRVPFLGTGFRAVARELFAFSLPEGGSDMGRAYMDAFVARDCDATVPLAYRPGESTRVPNRYYTCRAGSVEFFALDSNTLDAPAPSAARDAAHADAGRAVTVWEDRVNALDAALREDALALEHWRAGERRRRAEDPIRRAAALVAARDVGLALDALRAALHGGDRDETRAARRATKRAQSHWRRGVVDLSRAIEPDAAARAMTALEARRAEVNLALREVEGELVLLPESDRRTRLVAARDALPRALEGWSEADTGPGPEALCARIAKRSEEALEAQRGLARERRRATFRPEDHDGAQLAWLEEALEASVRERPDGWRVVYLHHPLFTTMVSYCETPEILAIREALVPMLRGRVHLVLSGHAHAFEWLRADALPTTGMFVTGAGGQTNLGRTLFDPRRFARQHFRYEALRAAGVTECAIAGRYGPAADDGVDGPLYHYLRIEVGPDALMVRPIGVRYGPAGWRRETPMPAHHVPSLPAGRPVWHVRTLAGVQIRRDAPPRACWS